MSAGRCIYEGCGAHIVFAVTIAGRRMPLDAAPNPTGNVAIWHDETATLRCRVLKDNEPTGPGETRMTPHCATCPGRSPKPQSPPEGPDNVVNLDEHRRRHADRPAPPP